MKTLTPKAQATRERILAAANELFYLHGYTASGVDRIIAAAGVTKGNFFYHFKNKEELAVAVLDWHRDLALAELGVERLLQGESPRQALFDLARGMAGRMVCGDGSNRVRGCFFGNFALELSMDSEAVRAKVAEIFAGFREMIRLLLERAQAKGEVKRELDVVKMSGVILALMEGAVLLDKVSQRHDQVEVALAFIDSYL